jgi:hypothetical protein
LSIAFTHSEGCLTDTATSYTERYGGLNDNTTKSVTEGEYRSNNHVAKYKGQIVYVKRLKRQKIKAYLSVYDVAVSVRHPSLCVKAIDKACGNGAKEIYFNELMFLI